MVEITFKRKDNPANTFQDKLNALQALSPDRLKALCHELHIPFLLSAAPRLIARRLENGEGYSRLCDSLLRKPLTFMPLPDNGQEIVDAVVRGIAEEKGIQPEEVNIPKAIPDSFGFYEQVDPACGDCPYFKHCELWTLQLKPGCFGVFHHRESAACLSCLYRPWCSIALEV